MSDADRRQAHRAPIDLFFNKYIDGYPHLCRTIDISEGGLLLERVNEPSVQREFYPVEIGWVDASDGPSGEKKPERLWLWAQQVWANGSRQALRFVGVEATERRKLEKILERVRSEEVS